MAWFRLTNTPRLTDFLAQLDDLTKQAAKVGPKPDKSSYNRRIALWLEFFDGRLLSPTKIGQVLSGRQNVKEADYFQLIYNYHRLFSFIDQAGDRLRKTLKPSLDMIKKLHQIITDSLIDQPNSGEYRKHRLVIQDAFNDHLVYTPPKPVQIPFLIYQLVKQLEQSIKSLPPVIQAAGAHYYLTAISPFVSHNDQVGRALGYIILKSRWPWFGNWVVLDDFFNQHQPEYSAALIKSWQSHEEVMEQDISQWCQFYAQAALVSLESTKSPPITRPSPAPVPAHQPADQPKPESTMTHHPPPPDDKLSPREQVLLDYLRIHSRLRIAEARFLLPDVSDDTILRALHKLQARGLVVKRGRTKGVFYQFAGLKGETR